MTFISLLFVHLKLNFQRLVTDLKQLLMPVSSTSQLRHVFNTLFAFLYPPARVAGLLANNSAATGGSATDLQAPAASRRGSTNATLIRMGEATTLPLVLCGLLQHEFGSPFSPMPSRRSSHAPATASSPLRLEHSLMSSVRSAYNRNWKISHFSRNALTQSIAIYRPQFIAKDTVN
jgi:hypothetical protein